MNRLDERWVRAPVAVCFRVGADVEHWPDILPHYRWVRVHERAGGLGRVEMAAWRGFGPFDWPTWWLSEMRIDAAEPAVYYRHVQGITRGMEVKWEFRPEREGTRVRIAHVWQGPGWPIIGRFAAEYVIGPHFISAIAQRTLAGVAREAERRAAAAHAEIRDA